MFNTRIFENSNSANTSAINIPNNQNNDNLSIPQPIDITHQRQHSIFNNSRFRRESIAHSQGMGGVSWGSVTIGSWLKDEVMMFGSQFQSQNGNGGNFGHVNLINPRRGSVRYNQAGLSMSPSNQASYLPELEADYCKDYSCCGQLLPTLHDLLRHYEEAHISPSPPIDQNDMLVANRNKNNMNNMHNIMETVSTNDVFLNNTHNNINQPSRLTGDGGGAHDGLSMPTSQFNIQQDTISQSAISQNNVAHDFRQPQHQQQRTHQSHQQQDHQASHMNQNQQVHPHQVHSMQQQNSRSQTPQLDDEDAMYIDDPARHLYVMENNENKPYRCPVIGCEKTYKNQNGLKYHRLHGHQNQTLKENPDGTISIIDPESNTPYLDGAGMEKDKPYRCEVCGKRYKNLNGLKYHRGHTTH